MCCTAEGWCCIFIGCRRASLLGLSDILKHFRPRNDGKPRYPVSKTWSETGSDIFWSSRCSIELDEIRKSFIFRQPHFPDGLEQPQNTRSGCSTCRGRREVFLKGHSQIKQSRSQPLQKAVVITSAPFLRAPVQDVFRPWRVLHRLLLIV